MHENEMWNGDPQDRFNCKPVKFVEHEILYTPSKKEDINGLEKQIAKYRKSLGMKPLKKLDENIPLY